MYKRREQGWLKHLDFILWDALALQIAFVLAYIIRLNDFFPYSSPLYARLAILMLTADVLVAAVFNTMHNVMKRSEGLEILQTLKHVLIVFLCSLLYIFSVKNGLEYSRIILFLTLGFHFVFGFIFRALWKVAVRKIWKNSSKKASVILVADEKYVPEILMRLRETDAMEYTGIVLTNRDGTGSEAGGIPVVAGLETAAEYICRNHVDEVFVYRDRTIIPKELPEYYRSINGFIYDRYAVFAKKDYVVTDDKMGEEISGTDLVDELLEACRQMGIVTHVHMPVLDLNDNCYVERISEEWVITIAPASPGGRRKQ